MSSPWEPDNSYKLIAHRFSGNKVYSNNQNIIKVFPKESLHLKELEKIGYRYYHEYIKLFHYAQILDEGKNWLKFPFIKGVDCAEAFKKNQKDILIIHLVDIFFDYLFKQLKLIDTEARVAPSVLNDVLEKLVINDKNKAGVNKYNIYNKKLYEHLHKYSRGSVPCHHDTSLSNFIFSKGNFYLIDFQYFSQHGDIAREIVQFFSIFILGKHLAKTQSNKLKELIVSLPTDVAKRLNFYMSRKIFMKYVYTGGINLLEDSKKLLTEGKTVLDYI